MTLVQGKFGSKCTFTDKFSKALEKCGIVESVLAWSKFKADQQLKGKQSGKKTNKLRGIAKLEDANNAGTKYVLLLFFLVIYFTNFTREKKLQIIFMTICFQFLQAFRPLHAHSN